MLRVLLADAGVGGVEDDGGECARGRLSRFSIGRTVISAPKSN